MIVVDVETTGTDPERHGIISIGAVDFESPGNTFFGECSIPAYIEVEHDALQCNGYNIEEIRNPEWRQPMKSLLLSFREWILNTQDRTFAGINPSFDRNFYGKMARLIEMKPCAPYRTVDLHTEVYSFMRRHRQLIPLKDGATDISTDTIHPFVGLPTEPRPHQALTGAVYEAEAFSRLWYGTSMFDQFACFPVPEYLKHSCHQSHNVRTDSEKVW